MYAVIKTGGKQYRVHEGEELYVELLDAEEGASIDLEDVLAVHDGDKLNFAVADAKVSAEVVKHGKGKKIRIFKYRPKNHQRKTQGHRQPYTKLKITEISL